MTDYTDSMANFPAAQQAIHAKCFHPSGSFSEFTKQDLEQSIPSRFEQMARQYPERLAIKTEQHELTYKELNATANRIARAILTQQVDQTRPVALLFESGAPLTAAMMAALKAGKFFVPLDPSLPNTRIAAALADCKANLLLSTRANLLSSAQFFGEDLRRMEFESIDKSTPATDLGLDISPRALAAVIYTSGSTGEPKGVLQSHRNVLHRGMVQTNAYHLCEHDRFSLLTSGTSNAVMSSFLTLMVGAALLPFKVQEHGVAALTSWLAEENITVCPISSPLFRILAESLRGDESFPNLRLLRFTSETVNKTLVEQYKKSFPTSCVAVNILSSTETGPSRIFFIDHKSEIAFDDVPVGYPVEDKETVLMDQTGKELGFGEVGEIAVRSRYLSPGYWRRPELTQAKYTSVLGNEESLYYTGDLGLMLPDGCLIHKGRKDFRVKIRGFSVGIGDVEAALHKHPGIQHAVVVSTSGDSGETQLTAYLTAMPGSTPTLVDLREFLAKQLPEYMIPAKFDVIETMPLTQNGKIDRQALPKLGNERPKLDELFVAPTSEVERQLARIWAELLTIDRVGIHDNFFALGGHSLAASRVVSRVLKTFQLDITQRSLFESPTIAQMAKVIAEHQNKQIDNDKLDSSLTEIEEMTEQSARQQLGHERIAKSFRK